MRYARMWGKLCKNDLEAALCEACFWDLLIKSNVDVKPNVDLSGKDSSPDFVCIKDGKKFYVEVTCIRINSATKATNLTDRPSGGGHYGLLTDKI